MFLGLVLVGSCFFKSTMKLDRVGTDTGFGTGFV